MSTVNELIKRLQEVVQEKPEIGNYRVKVNAHCSIQDKKQVRVVQNFQNGFRFLYSKQEIEIMGDKSSTGKTYTYKRN